MKNVANNEQVILESLTQGYNDAAMKQPVDWIAQEKEMLDLGNRVINDIAALSRLTGRRMQSDALFSDDPLCADIRIFTTSDKVPAYTIFIRDNAQEGGFSFVLRDGSGNPLAVTSNARAMTRELARNCGIQGWQAKTPKP